MNERPNVAPREAPRGAPHASHTGGARPALRAKAADLVRLFVLELGRACEALRSELLFAARWLPKG